ncbi:MAG: hypothetical protein AAFS01_11625 [Pseudomonadota bacterium]
MWIVAVICLAAVALWYGNKRRGQRFVRAVHYLDLVESGASSDEANGMVARLFSKQSTPEADVAAIELATDRANRFTEGKQLPWIDEARQKGFKIDSGDARFDMAHLSRAGSETYSQGFAAAQLALSAVYRTGAHRFKSSTDRLRPAVEALADAAIRWVFRGALAGFIAGFFVPRVLFGDLEIWAIPLVTAFFGICCGLVIGVVYRVLRWAFVR